MTEATCKKVVTFYTLGVHLLGKKEKKGGTNWSKKKKKWCSGRTTISVGYYYIAVSYYYMGMELSSSYTIVFSTLYFFLLGNKSY